MPYVRKTRDRWDIETNHGYGWETECSSYDYNDARDTLYDYRANACGRFSTRLVKRREYLKAKEPPAPKIYPRSKELPPFTYNITQSFDWEGDILATTIATQMRDASDRVVLQHYQTDFTELREFLEAKRAGLRLVAVKPGHGRLVDADALVDSFDPSDFWNSDAEDNCFAAVHVVNSAPTVIPADTEAESP